MPLYDVSCPKCQEVLEENILLEDLEKGPMPCGKCGGARKREFPITAIKGFQPFEAYYDEGLGMDIHGREERKEAMKALGLQEAGDPVGGARNLETSEFAQTMKPQAPRGITLGQLQKEQADAREDWDISVETSDGREKPIDPYNLKGL